MRLDWQKAGAVYLKLSLVAGRAEPSDVGQHDSTVHTSLLATTVRQTIGVTNKPPLGVGRPQGLHLSEIPAGRVAATVGGIGRHSHAREL